MQPCNLQILYQIYATAKICLGSQKPVKSIWLYVCGCWVPLASLFFKFDGSVCGLALQSLVNKKTVRRAIAQRQIGVTQTISKASVSSFAYQGTNAHCILGKQAHQIPDISAQLVPFVRKRYWFQVSPSRLYLCKVTTDQMKLELIGSQLQQLSTSSLLLMSSSKILPLRFYQCR